MPVDSAKNEEGLVNRRTSKPESASLTLSNGLLQAWIPKVELINNPDNLDTAEFDKRLAVADLQFLFADLLEFYPNLQPDLLASVFKKGISNIDDPDLDAIHHFYQYFAKPKKLTAQISRLICGLPAFKNNNLGALKFFSGVRSGSSQISEDQILQTIKPIVNLINKALAAAQLHRSGNEILLTNYQNLHKSLDIPLPSVFFFRERIENLRQKINIFKITNPQILDRIVNLEESVQAMILAKKYFGKNGPLIIIPTVSTREKTAGHVEYGVSDKLSFLEDQLNYFNHILHIFLQHQINNTIQQVQSLQNVNLQDTLSSVLELQSDDLDPSDEEDPVPTESHLRKEKKYTEQLGNLIKVSDQIYILQGTDRFSGGIIQTRRLAEIFVGRVLSAKQSVENCLNEISGHRHTWYEITESSKATGLINKCLSILNNLQSRILEIEKEEIVKRLNWPNIPYSFNRASMPVNNLDQMTEELEQIIINLEADRMDLQEVLSAAKATLTQQENEFIQIKENLDRLIKKFTEMSGKKCTLSEVHDVIKAHLAG
jgi:hypothetical protein